MKTIIRSLQLVFVIFCIGLLPNTQAVSPAPDGGYSNGNTAEGQNALFSLTSGGYNAAIGYLSLRSDTTGSFNTAIGAGTLLVNTADENTATGAGALFHNTTAGMNTADGAFALFSNTTGIENTATGDDALFFNITGVHNTADGALALFSNAGSDNTAQGYAALNANTDGIEDTATGAEALQNNSSGNFNTAVGFQALSNNTTGSVNTAVGVGAGGNLTTGGGNVYIGYGVAGGGGGESSVTRIRNIGSTAIVGGATVVVESTGGIGDQRLGFASSSRRYKEEIKPMDKASETLFALKPVTFRAKGNMDPAHVTHYGLIAEDVAAVDTDLVVYNPEGKPETLRFESINAMLLNEFLKEHRKVEQQQASISQLKSEMQTMVVQLKEQAAQIQKVSTQLEVSKPAPQVVANKP